MAGETDGKIKFTGYDVNDNPRELWVDVINGKIVSALGDNTPSGTTAQRDAWFDPTGGAGRLPQAGDTWDNTTVGYRQYYNAAAGAWEPDLRFTQGAMNVYGLPPTARRQSAGAYSATNILGFRILNIGTGTLTLSPADGSTDIVITNAELTAMGASAYTDWTVPELNSITAGTGMELLLFTR